MRRRTLNCVEKKKKADPVCYRKVEGLKNVWFWKLARRLQHRTLRGSHRKIPRPRPCRGCRINQEGTTGFGLSCDEITTWSAILIYPTPTDSESRTRNIPVGARGTLTSFFLEPLSFRGFKYLSHVSYSFPSLFIDGTCASLKQCKASKHQPSG